MKFNDFQHHVKLCTRIKIKTNLMKGTCQKSQSMKSLDRKYLIKQFKVSERC